MDTNHLLPEVKTITLMDVIAAAQSLARVCEHSEVNLTVSDQIDLTINMKSDSFVKGKIKKAKYLRIATQWIPYEAGEYRLSTQGVLSFTEATTEKVLPHDHLDSVIEILSLSSEVPEELLAMSEAQQKAMAKDQNLKD